MVILIGALLIIAVGVVVGIRRQRRATLAGRDAGKPLYFAEPPARRVSDRKHEAL